MKNIGVILIIAGAVLLIACSLMPVSFLNDLADQNWYTGGSTALIIVGLLLHIYFKKKYVG